MASGIALPERVVEHFINKAGQALRLGYTTGSCAALAARAATRMLLTGREETTSSLVTPKGLPVAVPLHDVSISHEEAGCAVRKDAGDDPDITDGILVRATVRRAPGNGVGIEGGAGVGRVTRPGLDQPVGAAAINSVPRRMMENEVRAVCDELGYDGGIAVCISIPEGEALAARTFNPHLGIVGGLSVIGTSGIVEPMSTRAILDTIQAEMRVIRAEGAAGLILTPGNYGEEFLRATPEFARRPHVKCSNFIGESLDMAGSLGFKGVVLVGHIGKLVKLAGGVMDTHSRVADCRLELLALHAALAGVEAPRLRLILDATTVDDGMAIVEAQRDAVIAGIMERAEAYLARRAGGAFAVGLVLFSNHQGLLGVSQGAKTLFSQWEAMGG